MKGNIALNGSAPATAQGGVISAIYWNAQTKEDFLQKHAVNATIKAVKLYKNGKFEVQFSEPEDAVTMAKILVGDIPVPWGGTAPPTGESCPQDTQQTPPTEADQDANQTSLKALWGR